MAGVRENNNNVQGTSSGVSLLDATKKVKAAKQNSTSCFLPFGLKKMKEKMKNKNKKQKHDVHIPAEAPYTSPDLTLIDYEEERNWNPEFNSRDNQHLHYSNHMSKDNYEHLPNQSWCRFCTGVETEPGTTQCSSSESQSSEEDSFDKEVAENYGAMRRRASALHDVRVTVEVEPLYSSIPYDTTETLPNLESPGYSGTLV